MWLAIEEFLMLDKKGKSLSHALICIENFVKSINDSVSHLFVDISL